MPSSEMTMCVPHFSEPDRTVRLEIFYPVLQACGGSTAWARRRRTACIQSHAAKLAFGVLGEFRARGALADEAEDVGTELPFRPVPFDEVKAEVKQVLRLKPFGLPQALARVGFVAVDEAGELLQR